MKKTITNEQVLDAVYDLADVCGMRIDEFVAHLQEEYGDPEFSTDGLPEEIVAELENAKALRKESRDHKRKQEKDLAMQKEIEEFRKAFPDVDAEEIPASVWEDAANGMDLCHAYAFYMIGEQAKGERVNAVNKETAFRSASAHSEGSTEPSFSREQVEKMSPKEVSKNYKNILRSMKAWRY